MGSPSSRAVVVVPGHQGVLDQPDRGGQRPPGGRGTAQLAVGGELEDGDEVRQRVRAGAADGDRAAGKGRGAQEGGAGPAALGRRGPLTSDADSALGHQETLAARPPVAWEPRRQKVPGTRPMCHGGGMRVTGVDACRRGWVAVSLDGAERAGVAARLRVDAVRVHETLAGVLDGSRGPRWSGSTCRWACSSRAGARRTAPRAGCSDPGAARSSPSRPGRSGSRPATRRPASAAAS